MVEKADMRKGVRNVLRQSAGSDLAGLMAIWRARDLDEWSRSPDVYRVLSESILGQGEPLLAYDVIREGLDVWPADVRLRQLQGLSLARSGATERANALLEQLRREGQTDEETLGMLGRTYKDLATRALTAEVRYKYLKQAAEIYAQAFVGTGGCWSGINAATINLLMGNEAAARQFACGVRDQCQEAVLKNGEDDYWALAALGEAALILQRWPEAKEWYERAAQAGAGRYGDLHSTRRNAHLILQHWKVDPQEIDGCLRLPPIVVFAGHMIDRHDRAEPRFPKDMEKAVAAEIATWIDRVKPSFGFASAACGADILFLEAMLERGAEVSVVLPYNREEFVRDSVDFLAGSDWRKRFERVMTQAARVLVASDEKLQIGGVSYDFCNQLLLGLAAIRSQQLESELIPLVVWNGKPGDGPGGVSSVVENWRTLGYKLAVIDLEKIRVSGAERGRAAGTSVEISKIKPAEISSTAGSGFGSRLVSILFADAVGFSKLSEVEVPRFVDEFLGAIAQLSSRFGESIVAKNTWGDGLYFVFSTVDGAGRFALQLADLASQTKWEEKGLRADLNLRIALHAGPAYEFDDPITGNRSYSGTHVSRAARLEPITPAGQVYATEAFAALAAAHRSADFTSEYVGQTPMAKGYGTMPTYHVRTKFSLGTEASD